ncbi:MAG: SAM-dependent methyltransferase, partial [Actinomycetota bacterium]
MGIAESIRPAIRALFGERTLPVAIRFWDGSTLGSSRGETAVLVRSPDALRRLLWSPNELGLGRAYVAGDIDIEGDISEALRLRDAIADRRSEARLDLGPKGWIRLLAAARSAGALGLPLGPPPEEARLKGRRHSVARDSEAVSHHYDVS